jgi:YidC/Oxa1 family membrane protein insertase
MDRKTILLVILLAAAIILYWPALRYLEIIEDEPEQTETTAPTELPAVDTAETQPAAPQALTPSPVVEDTVEAGFETAQLDSAQVDTVFVETQLYRVALINKGGGPVSIKLKEWAYREDYREGEPIEMLPHAVSATPEMRFAQGTQSSATTLFTSSVQPGEYEALGSPFEITYRYSHPDGLRMERRYTFYPDRYHYDLAIDVTNANQLGRDTRYQLVWNTPPGVTEPQIKSDYDAMEVVVMAGGSRDALDDFEDDLLDESLTGDINWVGVRSKYFAGVFIPRSQHGESAHGWGSKTEIKTVEGSVERREVTAAITMEYTNAVTIADSFSVFVGPLDYKVMSGYNNDLEELLGIGTTPVVGLLMKPFAILVLWIMPFLYGFLPNYGIVIIITALLMKIVTLPLSMKAFKSMQAMKDLQPKIEELKKKHKDNAQRMNQEMMKLYKKHGFNPLGGCLPMLLQMPLFIGFLRAAQSTILLRGAPFVWFVDDLSRGATGIGDPYIILVIVMVVAQFLSQRLTMASTQQNKALMYMMPLLMGFLLYSWPAGLILYWTCFSLFSLIDYALYRRPKNPEVKTA